MDFDRFSIAAFGLFWQQIGFGTDFASIRRISHKAEHFCTLHSHDCEFFIFQLCAEL
jgi:hypothetical protein